MNHSKIVGGSTAKRVISCPGSVALVAKMPPQVENKYMADGTALHSAVDLLVNDGDASAYSLLGKTFNGVTLDEDHCEKLKTALALLESAGALSAAAGSPLAGEDAVAARAAAARLERIIGL